jgi:NAD(P)-dependent dehydrogenase (short-subunit alcohol dehydrogenase family)
MVALLLADISSQQSVRALVQEFESRHDRLDVLINSVGVTLPRRTETVDGIEPSSAPFILVRSCSPTFCSSASSECAVSDHHGRSPEREVGCSQGPQ